MGSGGMECEVGGGWKEGVTGEFGFREGGLFC